MQINELIQLKRSSKHAHIWDVMLQQPSVLREYQEAEFTLSFYPISRKVIADSFHVYPYEEYVDDLSNDQRTTYVPIDYNGHKIFGVLIAVSIVGAFALFRPEELLSLQSLVSAIGAYAIGKELWIDVSRGLENVSKGWRLKWQRSDLQYERNYFDELEPYWQAARNLRYGFASVHADRMSFYSHSNSKTVSLLLTDSELHSKGKEVRLSSLHVNPELALVFQDAGSMVVCSVKLTKRLLWLKSQRQYIFTANVGTTADTKLPKTGQERILKLGNLQVRFSS